MASRVVRLVQLLDKKTKDGEIQWERTETDGVFQHAFPDYSVRIAFHQEEFADYYVLIIYNAEGSVIESVTNDDLEQEGLRNAFSVMQEMYNTARRAAMGIDEALDDLLKHLGDEDVSF
jgi:hypothetical protein